MTSSPPRPTWVDDSDYVAVWQGDCRDIMATLPGDSVDVVLADPGYAIPEPAATTRSHARNVTTMAEHAELNTPAPGWLQYATRLLRAGGYVVEFCNSHLEALTQTLAEHRMAGLVPWIPYAFVKTTVPHTVRPTFCHGFELAVVSYKAPHRAGWWGGGATINRWIGLSPASRRTGTGHPYEKPLPPLRVLIKALSPPSGRVLDPFAGSGSSLVAAREVGRTAWGIELEPGWVECIKARLAQGVLFKPSTERAAATQALFASSDPQGISEPRKEAAS